MSDYYKSLISDDDVIKELVKDSKRREGTLETPRVRPNLNFFQRTVSGLVSSNIRTDKKTDSFRSDYLKKNKMPNKCKAPAYESTRSKPTADYEHEKQLILGNKTKFVRPQAERRKRKKIEPCRNGPLSFRSSDDSSTEETSPKRSRTCNINTEVICISSNDEEDIK